MIVTMTLEHAIYVCRNMRESQRQNIQSMRFSYSPEEFAIDRFQTDGLKLTAIANDGAPVGIGGLTLTGPGVWTSWVVGTDRWRECSAEIIWSARKHVRMMFEKDICHRVQAYVATGDIDARRYATLVGLPWECDMHCVTKDRKGVSMYAKVKR